MNQVLLETTQKAQRAINTYWNKGLIFFWIGILILYIISGTPSVFPSNQLPITNTGSLIPTQELSSIDYKNCPYTKSHTQISTENSLSTNTTIGYIDLVTDTEDSGIEKGEIPPIIDPTFERGTEFTSCIEPDSSIIILKDGAKTFGITFQILEAHQIIRIPLESEYYALVTYSPFAKSVNTFLIPDENFGLSGRLFGGSSLLYDYSTESLWLQPTGLALLGERTGEQLTPYPFSIISYKDLEDLETIDIISFKTGYSYDYNEKPYDLFYETEQIMGESNSDTPKLLQKNIWAESTDAVIYNYALEQITNLYNEVFSEN
ncbi:DUF3179 domain-containing protein [Candidatus Dojkabacteria bacterium]|uniref:DUF3179 domain-containing protein n=1 Tax=Candidatus Dojkabacteria bacterium TaxID=2099670 RepID=A0A955RK73_9BACT|nr:DUF3179 domain-containing protein [Candidatus Dojkabacteria bacterium]